VSGYLSLTKEAQISQQCRLTMMMIIIKSNYFVPHHYVVASEAGFMTGELLTSRSWDGADHQPKSSLVPLK